MCLDRPEGSVVLARKLHVVLMLDTAVSSVPATEADRMASWRGSEAAAEARKAEGAACTRSSLQVSTCVPATTLVSTV